MADMNFGVNLLPVNNKSNTLGSSSKKWDDIYVDKINGQSPTNIGESMTEAEYDALTSEQKMDGSIRFITDGDADTVNVGQLQKGLAIIVDGDSAAVTVEPGMYAYLKNNTHNLPEGLYTNTNSAAFPTGGGTAADSTYFTAVSGGGLNAIQQSMAYHVGDTFSFGGVPVIFRTLVSRAALLFRYILPKPIGSDVGSFTITVSGNSPTYSTLSSGIGTAGEVQAGANASNIAIINGSVQFSFPTNRTPLSEGTFGICELNATITFT